MYEVICEWDIGIEGKIFSNYDTAEKHARLNLISCGIDDDYEELEADGCVRIKPVEVIYD